MERGERITRRGFVKAAAACAGMPFVVQGTALGLGEKPAAADRVALGWIGTGDRGRYDMQELMKYGGQVVALCDVKEWEREAGRKVATIPVNDTYNDFRDLLRRKDIDAVLVTTNDHWHVPASIAAVRAGKDVYVEKPLGITIEEGKAMRAAVKASKCVFMHGTEQRAMPDVRHVCELVRNGRLGKIHTITAAVPGGIELPEPQPEMPIPKGFDFDMWLGPARKVPYTEKRVEKPWHFHISDYASSGFINGWGIHHLDIVQWALDMDASGPVEIEGTGTFPKTGMLDTALTWRIQYTYANGVKLIFTDTSQNPEGIKFEGTEGWIFKAYRQPATAEPASLVTSVIGANEIHLYDVQSGSDDACFIECVRSRKETCSPIEAAHRSTTVGYLGDIAIRLKRKLRWDPVKEEFKDDAEANKMLSRPLRAPWTL